MVSYYNTLSSMFPSAHHPGAQPHPIAAGRHGSAHSPAAVAAAAAQSASAYLHGYHPSAAAAYHQQFAAAASAGHHHVSNAAAAAAAAAQYSDLNSNMYTGSSALASSPTQFQDGISSSHHPPAMGTSNGGGGTSWHAQSVWHTSPQFNSLQSNSHPNDGRTAASLAEAYGSWAGPTSTPSLATATSSINNITNSTPEDSSSEVQNSSVSDSGGGQSIVQSAAATTSDHSPPTPSGCDSGPSNRNISSHPPPQGSPGLGYTANAAHSHSSGSPSATPTPGLFPSQHHGGHNQQDPQNDSSGGVFTKYPFQHSPVGFMTKSEMTSPPGKPHLVSSGVADYLAGGSDQEMHGGSAYISSHAGLSPSSMSPPSSRPQPARSPFEWMKKPSYQAQTEKNAGRTRTKDKYRIVYSDHQRLELEKEFHYSRYITIRRKAELANSVGLSERQVKIWFQNRRAKERRALKKQEDTLVKEKLDPSAAAVHAMSAFTDSITAAHQYNNGSAIATAAGQMAIGMPHVSGNPHVSTGTGFPGHSMMASAPYGMSMKFE